GAVLEKVGPGYAPRVLAVTAGTRVRFRNVNSPCQGFASGSPWHTFNVMVPAGSHHDYTFTRPDLCRGTCNLRPYIVGWVGALDPPYCAVTGADGTFTVRNIPPGEYTVTVWHEEAGRLKADAGPPAVTVRAGKTAALRYTLK